MEHYFLLFKVKTIEDYAFYGLANLTILDMMQCQVSSPLTNHTFVGLSSLKEVYLDLNHVGRIDAGALRPMPSLEELWMSDNNLTTLAPEVLDTAHLTRLNEVYLDGNPWRCDCHIRWLREAIDNAKYTVEAPGLMKCAAPPNLANKSFIDLKPSDFVCKEPY